MKKLLFILFALVTYNISLAQCNPYYFIKENARWEMNTFNKKGKLEGRYVSEAIQYNEDSDGWKALIKSTYFDKKDKEVHSGEFELNCENGKVMINMERMIPKESLEGFKNMNMEMKGDFIEIPNDLSVGQTLSDGSLKFTGDMPFNVSFRMYDRKVTGKEKITVPAGTFDCYKIEYKMEIKTLVNMETTGVEYVAEKVGAVKQETYRKGKLTGYSELSSYSF